MNPDQAFGEASPDVPRGPAEVATPGVHPSSSPRAVPAGPARLDGIKAVAVGQAAIGGALILCTATALTAVAGHRRGGGKRGVTHARTSRRPAGSARPASTGDPFIVGAPWNGGPEPPPDPDPAEHADDYPSWRGHPGPNAPQDSPPRPPAGGRPPAGSRPDRSATGPRPYRPAVDARPHGPAPGAGFAPAPVYSDGAAGIIERVRPEASRVRPEVRHVQPANGQVWDADSVQLATWIISEANQQATEIRHEARHHAAASLAGAKQEAAELMRQAAERAAATLAPAGRAAAEARAEVMKLSAHLGGVASYVAENLGTRALPPARSVDQLMIGAPVAAPATMPVAEPAVKPKAAPRERPAARTAAKPAAGAKTGTATPPAAKAAIPAADPNAVPRQILAGRVMGIIVLAMFMVALLAGTSEVALHGFRFFVFRSVGTGETSSNGLQENQGPGQADAPGAHR
jgi:hypothetical protein